MARAAEVVALLDPTRDSYSRVFLGQVLPRSPAQHVSVCGVVTSFAKYFNRLSLVLDDGTAAVPCSLWRNWRDVLACWACCRQSFPDCPPAVSELSPSLRHYVGGTQCWFCSDVGVGAHLSVFGVAKMFNGSPHISVHFMRPSADSQSRWIALCLAMAEVYSSRPRCHPILVQTVADCIAEDKFERREQSLAEFLRQNRITRFLPWELLDYRGLPAFDGMNNLRDVEQVLARLEASGAVRSDAGANFCEYVVVASATGLSLEEMVRRVMASREDDHYKRIAGRVRNMFGLPRLADRAVLGVLAKLEEESWIMSCHRNCYSLMPDF